MTILMPQIAARVFNTPLMVAEDKAAAFLMGLGGRLVEGGVVLVNAPDPVDHKAFSTVDPAMGRLGDRMGRQIAERGQLPFDLIDGVAVIAVEGTLVHKGAYIGQSSGETSYQGLQTQIAAAHRDPRVKGVAFEVDSFGGQVAGGFETADMIARLSRDKPTMAILTDFALSGGYLLASACRQIVMPETGVVGSIGVIVMHADLSQKLEKDGIKVTLLTSGARKADGHPSSALDPAAEKLIQARIDDTRQLFAGRVGTYRKGRITKAQALATEAGVYHNETAIAAGLADAIANPHDAFAAFVSAVKRAA